MCEFVLVPVYEEIPGESTASHVPSDSDAKQLFLFSLTLLEEFRIFSAFSSGAPSRSKVVKAVPDAQVLLHVAVVAHLSRRSCRFPSCIPMMPES